MDTPTLRLLKIAQSALFAHSGVDEQVRVEYILLMVQHCDRLCKLELHCSVEDTIIGECLEMTLLEHLLGKITLESISQVFTPLQNLLGTLSQIEQRPDVPRVYITTRSVSVKSSQDKLIELPGAVKYELTFDSLSGPESISLFSDQF